MFKRVIFMLALLVFASGILLTSVWRTSAQTLEKSNGVISPEVKGGMTFVPKKEVDYDLTYPGILPDHFLYPVKMIRDRIWLWLTTDPAKKAELLLKFADKRIWAAQMLVDKGKTSLGVTTATKAEKYLERAINQAKTAREKGKEVSGLLENLSKATLKHEETLLSIKDKVNDDLETVVDNCLGYARRGYEEVREQNSN